MLTNLFLSIGGWIVGIFASLLPAWSIWPQAVHDFLYYTASTVANLNFLLPVDTFFQVVLFIVHFEFYYLIFIILKMIFGIVARRKIEL